MESVSIRPMTPDDIPVVADWITAVPLWQRYGLDAASVRSQFKKALHQLDILLVADLGAQNRACGFTWCLPDGGFGLSAYLKLIGVRQGLTGSGIGLALLSRTEDIAAEMSSDMFLLVSDFNEGAQRFYRRHGYQQIGAVPGYVLPDVDELIFWKRLRKASV
jgi:ribosomal protein S18 acetylase RimI-like enzyme